MAAQRQRHPVCWSPMPAPAQSRAVTTSELEQQTSAAQGAQSRLLVLQETVSEQERLIRELESTITNQKTIMEQVYADLELDEHATTDEAMAVLADAKQASALIARMGYYLVQSDLASATAAYESFIEAYGENGEHVVLGEADAQAFATYKARSLRIGNLLGDIFLIRNFLRFAGMLG